MREKRLRNGFTTGSCATAAAKAAAVFLLLKTEPEEVEVTLPQGSRVRFEPQRACEPWDPCFCVQKDGGDDPDVTNGSFVYSGVFPVSQEELERLKKNGRGYWLPGFPQLYVTGGPGVGIATLPGLSCPVGHYAINPVPRRMILWAVDQICREAGYQGCLQICVAIPDGMELGKSTFNPRLGIQGGISVLGTTGVVKPMSEEALLETIRLDIHMKRVLGHQTLILTPGNYGEAFLEKAMGLPMGQAVVCSNFIAASGEFARQEGMRAILLAGHMGKLVKVSAGRKNTHSRYGDGRMEELARLTRQVIGKRGGPDWLPDAVRSCNTTDEAAGLLKEQGLGEPVFALTAGEVKRRMEQWLGGQVQVEAVVFSTAQGLVGETEKAADLLRRWKQEEAG